MKTLEEQIGLAKMAEQVFTANRNDDMAEIMDAAVKLAATEGIELTNEDRNMLSVAYKNKVGNRRSAWRIVMSLEQRTYDEVDIWKRRIATEYREKLATELREICNQVLELLDQFLLPKANTAESKVFFLKMKGDYYRYIAEVTIGEDRQAIVEKPRQTYQEAFDIAKDNLEPTNPIRLGLVLNFSVFYYEILNMPEQACKLAREAFDGAADNMDKLSEDAYKDSTVIMQLLRDNLALWGGDDDDQTDEDEECAEADAVDEPEEVEVKDESKAVPE